MNTALLVAGLVVCVVALGTVVIKMLTKATRKGARNEERADRLAENAERKAEAEKVASQPLPDRTRLRAVWDRYRRRMSDSEGG